MKYWRSQWLLIKGPYNQVSTTDQDLASQFRLQVFRSRKRAFASVGLDVRKYPKPEVKGDFEYPGYWGDSVVILPWLGRDGEIGTYRISL